MQNNNNTKIVKNKEIHVNFPIDLLGLIGCEKNSGLYAAFEYDMGRRYRKMVGTHKQKLNKLSKLYRIGLRRDESEYYKRQERIKEMTKSKITTGIRLETLIDFYKNDKKEIDLAALLAFLAIKSIVGRNKYCFTNKKMILARMCGYESWQGGDNWENDESLNEFVRKFATRRKIERVLRLVGERYRIAFYWQKSRGFYVARKMTNETLKNMVNGTAEIEELGNYLIA